MYRIIGADGKEYGPISAEQLRQWIAEGRVNQDTQLLAEGSQEWRPLRSFPELAHFLTPAAGAPAQFPSAGGPIQRPHSMAMPAMVMGILALVLVCCCYGIPFNILGIIFASIALSAIGKQPEVYSGRSMALAGLIMSIISLALAVLVFIFGMATAMPDILRDMKNMQM